MAQRQGAEASSSVWTDLMVLFSLAGPMIVGSLSDVFLGIVDTAMVGRAGSIQLAGVSAGNAVYSVVSQVIGASIIGYQILAARRFGAKDTLGVGSAWWHGAALSLPLTVVGLAAFWSFPFSALVTSNVTVQEVATEFLRYRGLALPLFVLTLLMRTSADADRQTRWGMYASLLANGANILFNSILIFGFGPVPAMGGKGSALSSTLAVLLSFLFMLAVTIRRRLPGLLSFRTVQWRWEEAKQMLLLSGPEMTSSLLDYTGNLFFVSFAGSLGHHELAGSRIAFMVMIVLYIVSFCFGNSLQILVARALGQGHLDKLAGLAQSGTVMVLGLLGLVGAVIALLPLAISSLFTPDTIVGMASMGAVRLVGATAPLIAWTTCSVGLLRAFGKTKLIMYTNVIAVWAVQLPVGWLFGVHFGLGLTGLYLGYLAYFLARAVVTQLLVSRALLAVRREGKASLSL